jgi:hypothetical protein
MVGITLSVATAVGGIFVGWLDVVLTTLSRVCAEAEPEKQTAENTAHTTRPTILLEKFKLKTPVIYLSETTSGKW